MALDCSASFHGETVVYSPTRMRVFAYKAFGELIEALESGTAWDSILACDTLLQDVTLDGGQETGWRLCHYLGKAEYAFVILMNRRLLDTQDNLNNI